MIPPGSRVGNLVIGALLGRGGMGEVYAAEQISLKRPVAVKRIADHLADTPDAIRRFEREAQVVARIRSEHVVGIYELGTFADAAGRNHVLLLMELVEGGLSLKRLLTTPLPWAQATSLIRQSTEGLIAAADHHIVHRDIKPDNILLTRRGVAKLTDFGLAKALDSTAMTLGGSIMGTPAYMAPEVCRGNPADARSDLYSLGATWFHLLAGRTPFTSETTLGMLRAHIEEAAPDLRGLAADVPPAVAALVARLLAKDPAQRPGSAADLANAIDQLGVPVPRTVPDLAARFVAPAEAPTLIPTPLTKVPGSAPTVVATPSSHAATVVAAMTPTPAPAAAPTPVPVPAHPPSRSLSLLLMVAVVAVLAAAGGAWFASRSAAPVASPGAVPPAVAAAPVTPAQVAPVPPPTAVKPVGTPWSAPARTPAPAVKPSEPRVVDVPQAAAPSAPVVVEAPTRPAETPRALPAPVPGPVAATPVVPASSPDALLLQLDSALSERRFGDLQRLSDALEERDILPEQKDRAVEWWQAEEDRLWTELDNAEDLADRRQWPAALAALVPIPADPLHATKEVVKRHADLTRTIHKDATSYLDRALRFSDDLLKKGKPDAARRELTLARQAAEAMGRSAELDRALAALPSP